MKDRPQWGWAGTVSEFLQTPSTNWLDSLERHHHGLLNMPTSMSQRDAWVETEHVLRSTLRDVCVSNPEAVSWGLIFEYELPLEGGRRPDVVVLAGNAVVVLEFKQNPTNAQAAVDQVEAYARDLAEYHSESHDRVAPPIVVLPRANFPSRVEQTDISDAASLAKMLLERLRPGQIDVQQWVKGRYEPLPFLVAAARRIFDNEPLPHIKRALAAEIPLAVELLGSIAEGAAAEGRRVLGFIAGVPGSGKTLAGLSLVYQRTRKMSSATFLSGNGPLVEVLRDALKSGVFVKDLHAFIKTYGTTQRVPKEHVIVFDEAQRAWDAAYMQYKNNINRSEPDLLIDVGERLPGWACLVGLVGDGQEIHAGEESGIEQWHEAVRPDLGRSPWTVHCPPRLAGHFTTTETRTHPELDLTISLRSRRADHLHQWVSALLDGKVSDAARISRSIHASQFPMYVTRNLDDARTYLRNLYSDYPDARYGLLASSRSQGHLPKFGVDSSFPATKRVKLARWYNEGYGHPQSCCALQEVVTEFGCQGLELDFPVVCWSTDLKWQEESWKAREVRSRYPINDQDVIRKNAYRVLLTRGRDGLLVFVPPDVALNGTEHALLAAGLRPLEPSNSLLEAM
jgi:Uncharacterized conserved protein (DUF2075)